MSVKSILLHNQPIVVISLDNTKVIKSSISAASITLDPKGNGVSSAQIKITFDPNTFEATDVAMGSSLGTDAIIASKQIDNTKGTIDLAIARKGTTSKPTSPGSLAIIQFNVKPDAKPGNYTISISQIKLADETFKDITGIKVEPAVIRIGGDAIANINGDDVVDYRDLAILGTAYGSKKGDPAYQEAADLNGDGIVDYKDLAILGANYGK